MSGVRSSISSSDLSQQDIVPMDSDEEDTSNQSPMGTQPHPTDNERD
jgi:hypothetical protein